MQRTRLRVAVKKHLAALAATLLTTASAFAQDGDGELLDVDIDLDRTEWYESPWLWVWIAVFIIIVLLILRRPKKSTWGSGIRVRGSEPCAVCFRP